MSAQPKTAKVIKFPAPASASKRRVRSVHTQYTLTKLGSTFRLHKSSASTTFEGAMLAAVKRLKRGYAHTAYIYHADHLYAHLVRAHNTITITIYSSHSRRSRRPSPSRQK